MQRTSNSSESTLNIIYLQILTISAQLTSTMRASLLQISPNRRNANTSVLKLYTNVPAGHKRSLKLPATDKGNREFDTPKSK